MRTEGMEKESLDGLMEENMMEIGLMENNMGLGFIGIHKEESRKGSGLMGKE